MQVSGGAVYRIEHKSQAPLIASRAHCQVSYVVKLHIFSENSWFSEKIHNNSDFYRFFQKIYLNFFEKHNLNVVTSELDPKSLSTLRKIIFKRDSCKLLVDVTSVTSACHFLISENFRKFQNLRKNSESFRKSQKVSESLRKFQKVQT